MAPEHRAWRRQADCSLGVNGARDLGDAWDRSVAARRNDTLHGRGLVDVWETHLLHSVEMIEVAPVLLEAMRRRQSRGVVAQVVLAELAGGVTKIEQELGQAGVPGCKYDGLPGSCGGIMPVRSGYMPVKKALRPEVQLCMAT